jgi:hypothetical protein
MKVEDSRSTSGISLSATPAGANDVNMITGAEYKRGGFEENGVIHPTFPCRIKRKVAGRSRFIGDETLASALLWKLATKQRASS